MPGALGKGAGSCNSQHLRGKRKEQEKQCIWKLCAQISDLFMNKGALSWKSLLPELLEKRKKQSQCC